MSGDSERSGLVDRVAPVLGASLLRLLGGTWRLRTLRFEERERAIAAGERCIFAFWHARMLPLIYTHRNRRVAVLVSRSRDGELIARMVERLGFVTARGSSTRGGEEGARAMLQWAERGHLLTLAPDGPRGPAERVKPGLVWLASRTGLPILPVAAAARPCWVMRSWDRFRVPPPFARVLAGYGDLIRVPPDLASGDVEPWCRRIETAIADVTREVSVAAGETA